MGQEIEKFLTSHLGTAEFELLAIKKGGSDRRFFRVVLPDQSSFIFMHYGTEVAENAYWTGINRFLTGINIAVPQILAQDDRLRFILLEDLGDLDLWSQRNVSWPERRDYYDQVLRQIRNLHAFKLYSVPANLQLAEGYGIKLYRWEQQYFLDNFIQAICKHNLPPGRQKELAEELDGLTARLLKIAPALIHRDLQSQNILIKKGRPVLIDFQGLRQGCLFYDLGSLLCDPYVSFMDQERDELLAVYYELMRPPYSLAEFSSYFWDASAQRLMQALGAYGFLGLKKNKIDFLRHINNGLANLIIAARHAKRLPQLKNLAGECQKKMGKL